MVARNFFALSAAAVLVLAGQASARLGNSTATLPVAAPEDGNDVNDSEAWLREQYECLQQNLVVSQDSTLGQAFIRGFPFSQSGMPVQGQPDNAGSYPALEHVEPYLSIDKNSCFELTGPSYRGQKDVTAHSALDSAEQNAPAVMRSGLELMDAWWTYLWIALFAQKDSPERKIWTTKLAQFAADLEGYNPYADTTVQFVTDYVGRVEAFNVQGNTSPCVRYTAPFVAALQALPASYSRDHYRAFAERFGYVAPSIVHLGKRNVTVTQKHESHESHEDGPSILWWGDAVIAGGVCKNPKPFAVQYETFARTIDKLQGKGKHKRMVLKQLPAALLSKIDALSDLDNIQDMLLGGSD